MKTFLLLICIAAFIIPDRCFAQPSGPPPFDEEKARIASQIEDPEQATRAYLDSVPQERRTKTKNYARGNYILDIVQFLFHALLLIGILGFGISAAMRNRARSMVSKRPLQNGLYWIQFIVLMTVLDFPLTLYRSYFREKEYGLLTQTLPDWLVDQAKGLALAAIFGALLLMVLYGVFRKAARTWWIWGSAVMVAFLIFAAAIAPVFIMPLFNKFTPIQNERLRNTILQMARDHGVPADEVYEMDASKRTDRISAFVNGLLGTTRIVMFDNTLKRCTEEEIQMIMGHEMGHFVLNHVWKGIGFFALLIVLGFLFVRWAFARAVARWPRMGIESISDIAGFPLLWLLLSSVLFLSGPITNTYVRTIEDDADDFGLEASRQPNAAATTFLKLGEYRDLEPHSAVEALFYDHPSGRTRIRNAMKWKQRQAGGGR